MLPKTESELIELVRAECGSSNWRLGEQCALWKEKWGQKKTDEDFCRMVGGETFALTPDRVGRCRRVWEQFGMIHGQYRGLSWSHFDKVRQLAEENQTEALVWAEENEATVAEMVAWSRAMWGDAVRPETSEDGSEPEGVESPVVKSAEVKGESLGPRAEGLGEEEEEEGEGEIDPDHPMALIDAGSDHSSLLSPPPPRAQVANLIRCLKLEEQRLRQMWPDLTAGERKEITAVLELLVEFLTLETIS